jgi:hypothetical protein
MSFRRLFLVFKSDLAMHAKRPLTWVLVVVMALTVWGLSTGNVRIDSGDASVGGTKAWITSEFAIAYTLSVTVFLFYVFFLAIAAGMAIRTTSESARSCTPHRSPRTSTYGSFQNVLIAFTGIPRLPAALGDARLRPPNARPTRSEVRSCCRLFRPAIMFGLPTIVFRDDLVRRRPSLAEADPGLRPAGDDDPRMRVHLELVPPLGSGTRPMARPSGFGGSTRRTSSSTGGSSSSAVLDTVRRGVLDQPDRHAELGAVASSASGASPGRCAASKTTASNGSRRVRRGQTPVRSRR